MFFKLKEGSRTRGHKAALVKEQYVATCRQPYVRVQAMNRCLRWKLFVAISVLQVAICLVFVSRQSVGKENSTGTTRVSASKNTLSGTSDIPSADDSVIRILGWTKMIGRYLSWFPSGGEAFAKCHSRCEYTGERSTFDTSDVVLFHTFYVRSKAEMPSYRLPHQKWVFFGWEAPARHKYRVAEYRHWFNVTWGYATAADMHQPYGFCLPRWAAVGGTTDVLSAALYRIRPWMTKFMRHDEWRAPSLNETQRNYARGKTRLIACFVSKCVSPSRREEYVAQLKRHVAVDIYGKCGNLSCGSGPRPGVATLQHPECETVLNRTYKFYLAFENTICADYVTEKVWERLNLDIVPIVLGGANYSQLLPPHSYIDVRDFASPAALARHLANVDRNDTLYNSYFAWRQHYQCWGELPGFVDPCSVCDYLHRQRGRRQVVSDVSVFWSPSRCTPPQQYYAGIADIR
ncbi:Alpha-(1,3)-fucosyltransferase C [Lamellibrachia satsuma]|nr:Alpha-(1,3)-fucosyltransferase C [Lamellibrachia satsuma]